jgi:hypothetical protein
MSFSLKDIVEIVGILAIVASLIFVGLQLKQSHEIALAAQYQARADASASLHLAFQESGTSIQTVLAPDRPNGRENRLSDDQVNFANFAWFTFDNHHFQYQSGFLTDEAWAALSNRIQRFYSYCSFRPVFERNKYAMRDSFVEYVESFEDPCREMTKNDA